MRIGGRHRGLTLLEVILALSLLVMLLAIVFLFHQTALERSAEGAAMSRDAQLGRVILQQICDELRQASGYVEGYGVGLSGRVDEIEIYTLAVPDKDLFEKRSITDDPLPGQHDVRFVRYWLAWDEEIETEEGDPVCLGLVRREQRTLNQAMVVERETEEDELGLEDVEEDTRLELYAPEIKYLRFAFFDGTDWVKEWQPGGQKGNSLPQAVRVTVGYTPVVLDEDEFAMEEETEEDLEEDYIPPPDSFTMIVRLPMATEAIFGSRIVGIKSTLGGGG
jgi:prepilin-type N-terminal cleavage/methylation domain-containing protein